MNVMLFDFIRKALSKGKSKAEITQALAEAGWTKESIVSGLDAFADVEFVVPVPKPKLKSYISARESFLYLVMFSALYCCCYHIGSLLFAVIDSYLPDVVLSSEFRWINTQDEIRWAISTLIVSLPVFLYTFKLLNNEIRKSTHRRASLARKWLTYLTLFIVTLTLMGDGGILIYNLLKGELTTPFSLKVLTVAMIGAGNFIYFLREMRNEETE